MKKLKHLALVPLVIRSKAAKRKDCVGECTIQEPGDSDHPNKHYWEGTLVILDAPSTKPPHGAMGHQILVPKDVAKKRLSTLINTGINYSSSFDEHAPQKKVGVITSAWIEGNKLNVSGYVWKKDFPGSVKDLQTPGAGMSMELADVYVKDKDAPVWRLEDFQFTGATALYKKAAAYHQTTLAAQTGSDSVKGGTMAKQNVKTKKVAAAARDDRKPSIGSLVASALKESLPVVLTPLFEKQNRKLKKLAKRVDALAASQEELQASVSSAVVDMDDDDVEETVAAAADDDDEEDSEEIAAAKKTNGGDDDDDDEDDDGGMDEDDDDDDEDSDHKMEATEADPEINELNDDYDEEMNDKKTSSTGKVKGPDKSTIHPLKASRGKKMAGGDRLAAAALRANRTLRKKLNASAEETTRLKKQLQRTNNQIEALQASVDRYASMVDRKTLTPELSSILSKAGHDISDLYASGTKFSVAQVDGILSAHHLDVTTKIALKNQLVQAGMMEVGEVKR